MIRFKMLLLALLLVAPIQAQTVETLPDVSQLTLEQKVGQMFVMSFFGEALNLAGRELLTTWQPGAVVLLPSNLQNPQQITHLTNDIQSSLIDVGGYPALIAVDQEGGIIAHLEEGFTRWTVPSLLTATQNETLAHQFGEALAQEMLAVGINMNLAPVADLYTNLDNRVIGRRSFGHDPELTSPIIASVIEGMQANGVLATVKHFPGHGDTLADSHVELPVLDLSLDDLNARELRPFISAIEARTGAVMMAHIHFSQIDTDIVKPASLSERIIQDILRDDLAYDGLVITDALDMDAIDTVYSPANAALEAINAGNDLILLGAHISPDNQVEAMQAVVDAVRSGTLTEERIDESVSRILRAKSQFGMLEWSPLDPNEAEMRINSDVHRGLVDQFFIEGITLVQNQGELYPYQGSTLMVYPANRGTLGLECNRNGWQFFAVSQNPTEDEIAQAGQASRFIDNVIVFTENVRDNSRQAQLIDQLPLEKTTVVALWSPFDLLYLPPIATYFVTYSPLSQAYKPICDILHEEAQPQGVLSVMLEAQ